LLGLFCLGVWAWEQGDSYVYQLLQGRRLEALFGRSHARRHEGPGSARAGGRGELIGRIEIARLGLSAIIVEGVDARTLRRAVGHVPATALPGDPGNVVLAGHRDTFFRRLKDVRPGDRVRITTPDDVVEYDVESTRIVGPAQTDILAPTPGPSLTLITCYPFHYVGPAPDRFIVRARQNG